MILKNYLNCLTNILLNVKKVSFVMTFIWICKSGCMAAMSTISKHPFIGLEYHSPQRCSRDSAVSILSFISHPCSREHRGRCCTGTLIQRAECQTGGRADGRARQRSTLPFSPARRSAGLRWRAAGSQPLSKPRPSQRAAGETACDELCSVHPTD